MVQESFKKEGGTACLPYTILNRARYCRCVVERSFSAVPSLHHTHTRAAVFSLPLRPQDSAHGRHSGNVEQDTVCT